jgi:ferrochelatase
MPRTAVVLLNLGGPDSLEAVEPFLYNLFADPAIFRIPLGFLFQKPLARFISRKRSPEARHNYAAIGGKSPLLENTGSQARALAIALGDGHEVHIAMRYWHPRAEAVVQTLQQRGIQDVVLLPLYPQFSYTTTQSSIDDFRAACAAAGYTPRVRVIERWPTQPDYLAAVVDSLRAELAHFSDTDPSHLTVLFSAHGLPKKFVERGDPYQREIETTFEALRARLGWPNTILCYQSRVGPLEWLRPYTEDVIREQAAAGCRQMLVYPIAFVSDHSETLYELAIQYRDLAQAAGIREYRVTPALNAHPGLIRALAALVKEALP